METGWRGARLARGWAFGTVIGVAAGASSSACVGSGVPITRAGGRPGTRRCGKSLIEPVARSNCEDQNPARFPESALSNRVPEVGLELAAGVRFGSMPPTGAGKAKPA